MSDGTYLGRWLDEVAGTPHVSAEVKVLLLTMGRWMDETGHVSVPRPQMARILKCSERRVSSKYESAIKSGFFARTKAGSRGNTAEFQGRIPGVQPPERVTPRVSPNWGERVTSASTLSGGERVTSASTLSDQRVTTGVTQSSGKGDTHSVTPYIHTYGDDDHGSDGVVVDLFVEEKDTAPSLRSKKTPARKRAEPADDPNFDRFWQTYPKRVAKPAAIRAWKAAMKRKADPEQIIIAARRYATDPQRRETDIKYTAHPATWLNNERYADESAPSKTTASGRSVRDEWKYQR